MKHPILKDKTRLFTYLFLWIVAAVFQYIFVYSHFKQHTILILVATILQNLSLAVLFLGSWFGLRYINLETQKTIQFVTNHLIYLIIITLIWLSITNFLDYVFLRDILNDYKLKTTPIKSILGIFTYLLFVAYIYLDAYYTSYMEKIENERKLYETLKESELNLLKSQMNPHFIFNSLNSISSLTMLDAAKAQEMIIKLSDFLRYTVNSSKEQLVTLEKELEMCKDYLAIEKVRFGSKIEFDFEIQEESLPLKLPGMILQTLLENAIKHGVYNSLETEQIHFKSHVEQNRLIISLENSFDLDSKPKIGTKTGLTNIKTRLDLIYGQGAFLETKIHENKFTATLNLPAI